MFFRKSATFAATDHDAEAIARIKQCRLWSHVEFIFRADRDLRSRLARIATAPFRASEVERGLTFKVTRIEFLENRCVFHWVPPGPPSGWQALVKAECHAVHEPTPFHHVDTRV